MKRKKSLQVVSKKLDENVQFMKDEVGVGISFDVDYREIVVLRNRMQLYYINGLVDDTVIVHLLKELVNLNDHESEEVNIFELTKNRLVNQQIEVENKLQNITDQLLAGLIILFIDGEKEAFIIDVRNYAGRQPEEPDTERVIRGARDGFTENIIENCSLMRRRIKDPRLRNKIVQIGKRSKTDVCISFIDNIANDFYIEEIEKLLDEIDIDNLVMADKALVELMIDKKWSPFPLVRFTERPDVAAHHILSGYIVLIVDTSPSVIILPTTYFDHLEHAEEYRQTPTVGTFTRWIRITAVLASIFLLPLWLLFVLDPNLLPETLSFIGPKEKSSIPIYIQIIVADIGVEFLRMAAVHTPTPLATALGLIAAVLIGDIAVKVGLFTPEVILYVAISTIGSYVTPSYELSVANKFIKFWIVMMTILFKATGFVLASTIAILYLVQLKTLRTPYFWPLIPFHPRGIWQFIVRVPVQKVVERPVVIHPKDIIRQRVKDN